MLNKFMTILSLALLFPCSSHAFEVDFVLDLQPLTVLVSPDSDGFYLERSSGGTYYSSYERMEIEGSGSFMPTLDVGVGFDTSIARLDTTVGLGYLWNDAFGGVVSLVSFDAKFKLGRAVTLGPRIALVFSENLYFHDIDNDDVWLSAEEGMQGVMYGIDFTAGGKTVSFHLNLDYVDLKPYEVHNDYSSWAASDDELDLSGYAVGLGVVFHF